MPHTMWRRHSSRHAIVCGALACVAMVVPARPVAASATYHYAGNPFTLFSCGPNSDNTATIDCATPSPANPNTSYLATDLVTGTLTFDTPLPANLPLQDVSARPGFQLSLNDGHQTVSAPGPVGLIAEAATDANGQITTWRFVINTGGALNGGIATVNEPPSVQDQGTLACCDPTVPGNLALNQHVPGTWSGGSVLCDIELTQSTYTTGDAVVAQVFRFANPTAAGVATEIKVWLEVPGLPPIPLVRSGADGSVVFPAGLNANSGPSTLFTVTAQWPRGTYAFSCRLLNPSTGKLLSEDLNPFTIQ